MTSDWLWTLNSQEYPVYNKCVPPRPKFWPEKVSYGLSLFLDTRLLKIEKIRNVPKDLRLTLNTQGSKLTCIYMYQVWMTSELPWTHNSQKYTVYTEYFPQEPKFSSFHSTTSSFRDTRLLKIRNALSRPQNDLEHLPVTVKSTLYIPIMNPEVWILVHFALRPDIFEIY